MTKGCSGINYLGADSSNPFTADYVNDQHDAFFFGNPKTSVQRKTSQGTVRAHSVEKHRVSQPPDDRKP